MEKIGINMRRKTKEELDLMTREEFKKYRVKFLSKNTWSGKDERYSKEITFYMYTRFQDYEMLIIRKQFEEGDTHIGNPESHYKITLISNIPDDNEFKFITPMSMPNDITFDELIKYKELFNKK